MKVLGRVVLGVLFLAGLLAISAVDSSAYDIGFSQITSNSTINYAADFSATATDAGNNQVLLKFQNDSIGAISEVYFDNRGGSLSSFSGTYQNLGVVVYSDQNVNPAALPSGNNATPPFVTNFAFGATTSPANVNRVDNHADTGDILGIIFNLTGTFTDVTNDLASGDLRLGLHVQSLGAGNQFSESFVTPMPGALLLFGSGLVGLVGIGRREVRT